MLQKLILALRCCDYLWVTMAYADRYNPPERIKITSALLVEYVLPFSLHDHQRSFVIDEESRIQKLAA
jgi:hypothetical protein